MTRHSRSLAAALLALATACGGGGGGGDDTPASSTFTLHYHRPASDYAGWKLEIGAGSAQTLVESTTADGWGAVYAFELSPGAGTLAFRLVKDGTPDPAGALEVDVSGGARVAYVVQGHATVIPRELPAVPSGPNQAVIYYFRPDGTYSASNGQAYGAHLWGDQAKNTTWPARALPKGVDPDLGAGIVFDLTRDAPAGNCPAGRICFILHAGGDATKDPGPDITEWDPETHGNVIFFLSGSPVVSLVPRRPGSVELQGAAAHLVAPDLLLWNVDASAAATFELRHAAEGGVGIVGDDITGGEAIPLTPRTAPIPAELQAKVPHLTSAGWGAYDVAAADVPAVEAALRGQLVAVARKADGKALRGTGVQTAFALDALYAYDGPLGLSWTGAAPTVRLWAPTARAVTLEVYEGTGAEKTRIAQVPLTRGERGVYAHAGDAAWYGDYYRFVVEVFHPDTGRVETLAVTDPYSVSLSTDSLYSQFIDLDDPATKPEGWAALVKPPLDAPEDIVVYEAHVRDFSANDLTVPPAARGKYAAFAPVGAGQPRPDGLAYLAALAGAGLTHVHLLPAFDVATILEDPAARVDLDSPFGPATEPASLCAKNTAVPAALCTEHAGRTVREAIASYPGDSSKQQEIAGYLSRLDAFNWGYDPLHYGVPEGSYASTAEGAARILEFRQMVQGLAAVGLRTVMDVVYNHTNAAGLSPKSVLDKVVPGYYHRRNLTTGFVETSTCCANTATEHAMMRRLMKDTLVRWATAYRVDGFRFDLMGHHMKADVLEVRDALQALTVAGDGVDGAKIFLYGEGWDFGEVQANARGVNASQLNMAGTGVGTFNDRLRDAVRGGSPFDNAALPGVDIRRRQGFASGGWTDPNELAGTTALDKERYLESVDWLKAGLAGNLIDFPMVNIAGAVVAAGSIGYNGEQTAYTRDPQENVVYASAHDNQTLFDILQYKLPTALTMAERVRMLNLAMDVPLLAQGVPFVHMADERLRSKSMERDSYDSGDWFNRVDWSGEDNGWRSGLPNAGKDSGNWTLITQLFGNANIAPGPEHISAAAAHFQEMLRVRKSTPLFRLRTAAEVKRRVDFLNAGPEQVPGLVVMTVSDGVCAGADLDPALDGVVVILNADRVARTFTVAGATGFGLHPVLAGSADAVVTGAAFDDATDTFSVPARTAAVFVQGQAAAQGAGPACNTRAP